MKIQTYTVEYTKRIGGIGNILVKAISEGNAIENAKNLCATGSDFRNAILTDLGYQKPRKQGFAGFN